jgi:hypothetical protein
MGEIETKRRRARILFILFSPLFLAGFVAGAVHELRRIYRRRR